MRRAPSALCFLNVSGFWLQASCAGKQQDADGAGRNLHEMERHPVGFAISRTLAVLCAVWAIGQLAALALQLEMFRQAENAGSQALLLSRILATAPFAAQAILALWLWIRADQTSRAFFPNSPTSRTFEPIDGVELWRIVVKGIGLFVIVGAVPSILSTASYLVYRPESEFPFWQQPSGIEAAKDTLYLLIGIWLFFGSGRLKELVRGAKSGFAKAVDWQGSVPQSEEKRDS